MLLAIILGFSTDASATLIDRGGGLIYDTDTKGTTGIHTETKSDYIKVSYPSKAMPWIPLLLLDEDGSGGQSITGSVLYFEPDRELQTTELNGKVFDSGFSFSGWFNLTRMPAGSGDIMGFSYDDFWVTLQGDGSVNIHLKYTSTNITGLATQEWNNLAVTYDLSTVNFYLNGTLVGTSETSGPVEFPDDEGDTFTIGGYHGFYGYAAQIKIWKRGLSAEELNMEINRVDSSNSEGIEHQWLFDEGTGIQASDSVGGVDFKIRTPYWIDLDGPYEIDHDSMLRVTSESKLLPIPPAFGSADLNQDGNWPQ
jgi:hypothetical protein